MIGRTLNHDPTAAGPPFYGICSKPAYVWKDNMNASLDSPIQNSSTLFNDYFNIYPEQLSCDRVGWTKPPKEFTETPVTEKPSENIYYYSSFKDCIDKKMPYLVLKNGGIVGIYFLITSQVINLM